MNEFIEQFVSESRELAEQATSELATLERMPQDAELLDGLFRAFHTLKGGAAIVEFAAMERALHAVENVLSEVRAGKRSFTVALSGECLACLDQVLRWLDTTERAGEIPKDADEEANAIVRRFGDETGDEVQSAV